MKSRIFRTLILLSSIAIVATSCKQENVMKNDDLSLKTLVNAVGQKGETLASYYSKINFVVDTETSTIVVTEKKNGKKVHMFDDEVCISMPYSGSDYVISNIEIKCLTNSEYSKWSNDKTYFDCVCSLIVNEFGKDNLEKAETNGGNPITYTIKDSGRTIKVLGLDKVYITIE